MNRRSTVLAAICLLLLASCDVLSALRPTLSPETPATTPATPTLEPTQLPTLNVEPATPTPGSLVVWVPPLFDPQSGSPAGRLLSARLEAFSAEEPDLQVEVRVKAASGKAGLLNSLIATRPVAPAALPDLIALPRAELETAALKALIYAYPGFADALADSDWFAYAQQLAAVQGSPFGLPFAGDALVLAYRPTEISGPVSSWGNLFEQTGTLAVPLADPQALLALALYQASGGALYDAQGRPTLTTSELEAALQVFAQGSQAGFFPEWVAQLDSDHPAWRAYQDGRAPSVATWVSNYLTALPPDTAIQPLPATAGTPAGLASGWVWAIATPHADRQVQAARLAEYLVESTFLAEWTRSAGLLPTRPTAMAAWPNASEQSLLSQIVLSTQVQPMDDVLVALGPLVREALLKVTTEGLDPHQAAQSAVDQLTFP